MNAMRAGVGVFWRVICGWVRLARPRMVCSFIVGRLRGLGLCLRGRKETLADCGRSAYVTNWCHVFPQRAFRPTLCAYSRTAWSTMIKDAQRLAANVFRFYYRKHIPVSREKKLAVGPAPEGSLKTRRLRFQPVRKRTAPIGPAVTRATHAMRRSPSGVRL